MKYEDRELLARVIHYYHTRIFEKEEIRKYLQKIGLAHQDTCINFKLGYSGGLLNVLPDESDTLSKLKRIGVINEDGDEALGNSLIVPVRCEGKTFTSLMGINIASGEEKFLPGGEAIFNVEALKSSKEIFITDSIFNALLLFSIGIREVCSVIGDLNYKQLALLEKHQTRSVTLLVAKHNLQKYSKKIKSQGIAVGYIDVDSKSLSRLVVEGFKKDYCLTLVREPEIDMAEPIIEDRGEEIFYEFEDRRYRIRRLDPFRLDALRVNLKATHQGLWHLDTVDLYAERQRRNFIQQARKLIRLDKGFLYQDLLQIMDDLEDRQAKIILEKKDQHIEMSNLEKEEALKLLKSDDITKEVLKDFLFLGVVGEQINILIGYLSLVSRKLRNPLSILLYGSSASGKDTLKNTLLDVIPEEDVERFTKVSPQVLFYRDEMSLQNKALVIDDENSLKELESILVSLQNRGLSYSVTHKSPETGKLKNKDYKVKGPVSILVSVSNLKIIKKFVNHFVLLKMDESDEHRRNILLKEREAETIQGMLRKRKQELIKRKHRNAQRLLKPYIVINPYAEDLKYGVDTLDNGNLQSKYLSLIKAISLLRQYQKEIKRFEETGEEYIEVDLFDIEIADYLMDEVIRTMCPLSEETVRVIKDVDELVIEKANIHKDDRANVMFTRKELVAFSGINETKARRVLGELIEARYIEVASGKNGKIILYKMIRDAGGNLVKPCQNEVTRLKACK